MAEQDKRDERADAPRPTGRGADDTNRGLTSEGRREPVDRDDDYGHREVTDAPYGYGGIGWMGGQADPSPGGPNDDAGPESLEEFPRSEDVQPDREGDGAGRQKAPRGKRSNQD